MSAAQYETPRGHIDGANFQMPAQLQPWREPIVRHEVDVMDRPSSVTELPDFVAAPEEAPSITEEVGKYNPLVMAKDRDTFWASMPAKLQSLRQDLLQDPSKQTVFGYTGKVVEALPDRYRYGLYVQIQGEDPSAHPQAEQNHVGENIVYKRDAHRRFQPLSQEQEAVLNDRLESMDGLDSLAAAKALRFSFAGLTETVNSHLQGTGYERNVGIWLRDAPYLVAEDIFGAQPGEELTRTMFYNSEIGYQMRLKEAKANLDNPTF